MRKQRELALAATALFVVIAANAQTIPDIRDSFEPLEPAAATVPFALIACAGAALVILSLLAWWKRRSRSHSPLTESPEARADRRLAAIESANPHTFYTELHNIFIEYLENRASIDACRWTTPELLHALADAPLKHEALKHLLDDCDTAKFGPSQPDREPGAAVAECRALIQQVSTAPLLRIQQRRQTVELV